MSESKFHLRAMEREDSAAVAALISGFESEITSRFRIDAYEAMINGTANKTICVVVETGSFDGLVGMGTVRFGTVQFNGESLPIAFLDGLKVRPEYRGQGLGYQIAAWRIDQARALFGEDCIIATGMLTSNAASRGVAKKWCREFIEPLHPLFVPARSSPPKPPTGIVARALEPGEYAEYAFCQNAFYRNHNLYPPSNEASIAETAAIMVDGVEPYRFFAAFDAAGNLLAGARVWLRGLLKEDTVNDPSLPLRVLNRFVHFVSPDFLLRDVDVNGLWYADGQVQVGEYLWEWLRWRCREYGTMLTTGVDDRDPARDLIRMKPWYQPRIEIAYAIRGPASIDRGELLYIWGRV